MNTSHMNGLADVSAGNCTNKSRAHNVVETCKDSGCLWINSVNVPDCISKQWNSLCMNC